MATKDVPRSVKAMAKSMVVGKKRFLGKRTAPIHTKTSTAFRTRFVTAAAEKATLHRIVQARVKEKENMAKAKERVAKVILERVMAHTSPSEDGT